MNKLIMWDFDGVFTDTEQFLYTVWNSYIKNTKGKDISPNFWQEKMSGLNSYDKAIVLLDNYYMAVNYKEINQICIEKLEQGEGLKITHQIEDILNSTPNQCIVTNSGLKETTLKMKALNIQKYFTKDKIFTSEMVSRGKPAPDLFLYAAKQMETELKDCIVVEDSPYCAKTAQSLGIDTILFTEHSKTDMNILERLAIQKVATDVSALKKLLYSTTQVNLIDTKMAKNR